MIKRKQTNKQTKKKNWRFLLTYDVLLKVSSAFERGFATGFREKKKADQYFHLEITSFGAKTGDLGGKKTKKKTALLRKK